MLCLVLGHVPCQTARIKRFVLAGGLLLWLAAGAWAADPVMKNSDCLLCHEDKTLAKTNAAGRVTSLFVDQAKFAASRHGTNLCAGCHSDLKSTHPDDNVAAKPVSCAQCHERQSESYNASVHGIALKAGKADSATCADCHGSHEILPPNSPNSPLYYTRLTATCGECHSEEAKEVTQSIHGKALAKGYREAATCTDCHSEHKIEPLRGATSYKIAGAVCSKCHASERLNSKYRMPANRVKTFYESYHGLAVSYGSTRAANCASCHGVHNILPSSDPRSTINTNHLAETCGKCHPGASANFAQSKVHVELNANGDLGSRISWWIRRLYLVLIVAVIGGMLAHNGLTLWKKVKAARLAMGETILRMDAHQRIQHLLLLTSFCLLAWTGFALKFPDSWLSWLLGSQEELRRSIHRIAGLVMLGLGFYHLVYIAMSARGRQLVRDLWPTMQDLRDVVTAVKYLANRSAEKPRFGRFGYIEKAEYWAVVWGTLIMGVTGLMIWLKIDVTRFLPRWAVDVATTIHYYEAILACLAIIVWHFYHVFFDPGVYPGNWAFWDGRMDAHHYREEHPLDTQVQPAPATSAKAETASAPGAKTP